MSEESNLKFMTLWESKIWINAVLYEANEILLLNDRLAILFESSMKTHRNINNDINELRDLQRTKEYFFVIALNKSRDWLKEATIYEASLKGLFEKIDYELPFIREVRNMREHEIDYYRGNGRKQSDFIRRQENSMSDATSTIVNDSGYLVGGRINVQRAINIFQSVKFVIEKKFQDYVEGK